MALIPRKTYENTAVIAASGTTSNAVDLEENDLVGVIFPASMTGTSVTITMAASLTGTYNTHYDQSGSAVTISVVNGSAAIDNLAHTAGLRFIKLVSNGTEAAERTITLVQRRTS